MVELGGWWVNLFCIIAASFPLGKCQMSFSQKETVTINAAVPVESSQVLTLAGDITLPFGAFLDAAGSAARFDDPRDVAIVETKDPPSFKAYVVDTTNNAIRTIDMTDGGYGTVATLAGNAQPGFEDGDGANARFFKPSSLVWDPTKKLFFIVDSGNHAIRSMDQTGKVATVLGGSRGRAETRYATFTMCRGCDGANLPKCYCSLDITDDLCQTTNSTHFKPCQLDNSTQYPQPLDTPDAVLSLPLGITVSNMGFGGRFTLLVTDADNQRVVAFSEDDEVYGVEPITASLNGWIATTVAGSGEVGSANGNALEATFKYPAGIAQCPNGDIFIADKLNNQIRVLSRSPKQAPRWQDEMWTVQRANGNEAGLPGDVDSQYKKTKPKASVTLEEILPAAFRLPNGIVCDSTDKVYIADTMNSVVRKMETTPPFLVSRVAGSIYGHGHIDGYDEDGRLNRPSGLSVTSTDLGALLVVADSRNNAIRTIQMLGPRLEEEVVVEEEVTCSTNCTSTASKPWRLPYYIWIATTIPLLLRVLNG